MRGKRRLESTENINKKLKLVPLPSRGEPIALGQNFTQYIDLQHIETELTLNTA
jgi:hypothetical protein